MQRALAVLPVVAVLALAGPAVAAPRPRTVTAPYTVSGVQGVIEGDAAAQGGAVGAVRVALKTAERWVKVTLVDASGRPAAADVGLDLDNDGHADEWLGSFCGSTAKPLRITDYRSSLLVYPVAGTCGTAAAVATRGTATIVIGK
jgi:hypothetical protein